MSQDTENNKTHNEKPTEEDSEKNHGKILKEATSYAQVIDHNAAPSQVSENEQTVETCPVLLTKSNKSEISKKLAQFKYSSNKLENKEFVTPSSSLTDLMVNPVKEIGSQKQTKQNDLDLEDHNIQNLVGLLDLNDTNPPKSYSQTINKDFDDILLQARKKRKRNESSEIEVPLGDKAILLNVQTDNSSPKSQRETTNNTDNSGDIEKYVNKESDALNQSIEGENKQSDNTNNQVESAPKTGVTVTIDNGEKHVSFQTDVEPKPELNLPPKAFLLFKKARNAKLTMIKYQERVAHLTRMMELEKAPLWAVNCSQWPDTILDEDDKQAFVSLHLMHAKERIDMMLAILRKKIAEEESEFGAFYSTFSTYCQQNGLHEDEKIAEMILSKVANSEQRKSEAVFRSKEEKTALPTAERIWTGLTSMGQSRRVRQRSRSRSRTRSPSPAPQRRARVENIPRGRGRGFRGNYRGSNTRGNWRGNYRGRGNRGNVRGGSRGSGRPYPDDYNARSHGGIEVRHLQDHEAAMVLALRESLRAPNSAQ